MHYVASLQAMHRLLKPGGLLVVTCASYGRGAHGTRWRFPEVSLTSQVEEGGWSDYYMNIGPAEVAAVLPEHAWSYFRFFYRKSPGDMYMVAIKTGGLHSFLDVKEFSLFDPLAQEVDPYALPEL
jgi:SAM-dependent methyltransferase